jgi:hypothetical protein
MLGGVWSLMYLAWNYEKMRRAPLDVILKFSRMPGKEAFQDG